MKIKSGHKITTKTTMVEWLQQILDMDNEMFELTISKIRDHRSKMLFLQSPEHMNDLLLNLQLKGDQ